MEIKTEHKELYDVVSSAYENEYVKLHEEKNKLDAEIKTQHLKLIHDFKFDLGLIINNSFMIEQIENKQRLLDNFLTEYNNVVKR